MIRKPRRARYWFGLLQGLAVVLVSFAAMAAISAAEKPRPPCGVEPYPSYPALDAPPDIVLWTQADLAGWSPPACTPWQNGSATLVVALAGRFRNASDATRCSRASARLRRYTTC